MTPTQRQTRLRWLDERLQEHRKANVKLRGLYQREVDPRVKQQRFKVLSEAATCRVRIQRIIAELENQEIQVKAPSAELVAKSKALATALEERSLKEMTVTAQLRLVSKIAKLISELV